MSIFKIDGALGDYIIVEPYEKSTVLKANEISTVFKVISIGDDCEVFGHKIKGDINREGAEVLVIVTPNSVEKTMMADKEVNYIRKDDVVAIVKNG